MANELIKKITVYGNQKVDYFHVIQGIASQSFIDATYAAGYIPIFTSSPLTLMLANYSDTIEAGSILDLPTEIVSFKIFRRENNVLQFIAQVDASITSLTDYLVANQTAYSYVIFAETSTLASQAITSNEVTTDWWNWSLTSYVESDQDGVYTVDEIWTFDIDLSSSALVQNIDRYVYPTFGEYPKVSIGQNRFKTGSLSARIGNINCVTSRYDYDTATTLKNFEDFIASGKPYLIKNRKGMVMPIQILRNSFENDDVTQEQITRINFNFIQLGDGSDISVVNPEALETP